MDLHKSPTLLTFSQQPSTIRFLSAATKFVALLEAKQISMQEFIEQAHAGLIELYAAGHHLGEIGLRRTPDDESRFSELFTDGNMNRISLLGQDRYYWNVYPSFEIEDTPALEDLCDDFNDIYRDLKMELEKIKTSRIEAMEDAYYMLKWSFKHDWGEHCINALKAIHALTLSE